MFYDQEVSELVFLRILTQKFKKQEERRNIEFVHLLLGITASKHIWKLTEMLCTRNINQF